MAPSKNKVTVKVKADTREAKKAIDQVARSMRKLRRAANKASDAMERLGSLGITLSGTEGIDDGP